MRTLETTLAVGGLAAVALALTAAGFWWVALPVAGLAASMVAMDQDDEEVEG